jgi:putative endonuclease
MSKQHDLGKKGEKIAATFLEEKGYKIVARNWRYSRAEVDIGASYNDALIFVEVKARSYDYYGQPEDFVTAKKQRLLSIAASAYMQKHNHDWEIRFDIISILFSGSSSYKIKHIEDAFFKGL